MHPPSADIGKAHARTHSVCSDPARLLLSNWVLRDVQTADTEEVLRFKDKAVLLGQFSGKPRVVDVHDATVDATENEEPCITFTLRGGGCDACGTDEIYQCVLEVDESGAEQLRVTRGVSCHCCLPAGSPGRTLDKDTFFAVPAN